MAAGSISCLTASYDCLCVGLVPLGVQLFDLAAPAVLCRAVLCCVVVTR